MNNKINMDFYEKMFAEQGDEIYRLGLGLSPKPG